MIKISSLWAMVLLGMVLIYSAALASPGAKSVWQLKNGGEECAHESSPDDPHSGFIFIHPNGMEHCFKKGR